MACSELNGFSRLPHPQGSEIFKEEETERKPEITDSFRETSFSGYNRSVVHRNSQGLQHLDKTSILSCQVKFLGGGEVRMKSHPYLRGYWHLIAAGRRNQLS